MSAPFVGSAYDSVEAVVLYVFGGLMHVILLCMLVLRIRLKFSDVVDARESITNHANMRRKMELFDFPALLGGILLCWTPVLLAGPPIPSVRAARTVLPPIGLMMYALLSMQSAL